MPLEDAAPCRGHLHLLSRHCMTAGSASVPDLACFDLYHLFHCHQLHFSHDTAKRSESIQNHTDA